MMNLNHPFHVRCSDPEACDYNCDACRRHRWWFHNYRRTRYSIDDSSVCCHEPLTLLDVLPMVRRYLTEDAREIFAECGRFRIHGMKDIVGIVRRYLHRVAVSYTFDDEGVAWILWKDSEMYYGRRGASRGECVTIVEPSGYYQCELIVRWDRWSVDFVWLDRTEEHSFDGVKHRTLRGYDTGIYIGGIHQGWREYCLDGYKHEANSGGCPLPWPPQYVTLRKWKLIVYGLLPNGELEPVPHPQMDCVY